MLQLSCRRFIPSRSGNPQSAESARNFHLQLPFNHPT